MKIKKAYIVTLLIFISGLSFSQTNQSVGIRLASVPEIYYQQETDSLSALRLMLNWQNNNQRITIMKIFKQYNEEKLPDNMSFFFGYGAHIGSKIWDQQIIDDSGHYWIKRWTPVIGLSAIAGVELSLSNIPLSVTFDIKPRIDFGGSSLYKTSLLRIAIGASYHF
jgi:hypothetical protein